MAAKKDAAAVDAVFDYLKDQNRPYSVNDIVMNLHKEHGKAAVQKALDKLVQDERVREKTYGKQKVYVISQANLGPTLSSEELKAMDKVIEDKEKRIKELEAKYREAQAELKAINSAMTTEEATALLDKLTQENAALAAKCKNFEANKVEILEKGARDKIRNDRAKYLGEWRSRKKQCMGILNGVLEGWPGSKADLMEQVGIDADEDVDAVLPAS